MFWAVAISFFFVLVDQSVYRLNDMSVMTALIFGRWPNVSHLLMGWAGLDTGSLSQIVPKLA